MSTITKSILGSLVLCVLMSWTKIAVAQEEFLCDATQESTQKLPVLDKSCPIGQGLWGKPKPKNRASIFWIQCGIYTRPMPLSQAKILYKRISSDVWMKPEAKGYRCLIGPYDGIDGARQDLKKIRAIPKYKQSFIREVAKKGSKSSSAPAKSKSKAKPKPKPPEKQPVKRPQPRPAKSVAATPKPPVSTDFSTKKGNGLPEVRKRTHIAKVNYAVPFIGTQSGVQFYMEYNKPWNRLSYDDSFRTCQKIGMKLATEPQWQRLRMSKVMEKEKWPVYLPYWGRDKKGLFASGKVTQLKGSSLLNVLCVDR